MQLCVLALHAGMCYLLYNPGLVQQVKVLVSDTRGC